MFLVTNESEKVKVYHMAILEWRIMKKKMSCEADLIKLSNLFTKDSTWKKKGMIGKVVKFS